MWQTKFDESFHKALYVSYLDSQIFNLSFDRNVSRITEYFLTVNICKELQHWNGKNHYMYKIEPEKSTYALYKACFDNHRMKVGGNIFSPTLFSSYSDGYKENLELIRNGRVDILLSSVNNDHKASSEFIIEVKAINPSLTKIRQDFKRIQHYLCATVSGFQNHLKGGYIVFIMHINQNKVHNDEELQILSANFITRFRKFLNKACDSIIQFDIRTEIIDRESSENLIEQEIDDYGEVIDRTFSAFSVIVEINKRGGPLKHYPEA
jgi:hypothetical protein